MHRREFVHTCFLAGAGVLAAPMLNFGRCRLEGASSGREYSTRAIGLIERALVIDMLGLLTLDWAKLRRWHEHPNSFGPEDAKAMQNSGINVFHPAVDLNRPEPHSSTLSWLKGWNRLVASHTRVFQRIDRCSDLETAKSTGRIGILLGMQNSDHFRTAADVELFYSHGQRLSQLTYNEANRIGYGCVEQMDRGLTSFGIAVIEAMNRAGMIIDVSHAGERTTLETFEASTRPVLVTHSNCKALVPHPRCKSDEVIRAMARKGGVMGITCVRTFAGRSEDASIEDALDHFDHVARLVGVEHIGVGSDNDLKGRDRSIRGLDQARRMFDLTEGFIERGYSDAAIELMLGGNFKRAMNTVFA